MNINKEMAPGTILTNSELTSVFGVSNMGGIRKSNKNNLLVVIVDHTKATYQDRWEKDILHYTGMGLKGDQKLDRQNKTILESNITGIEMYLFEVFVTNKYLYQGKVKLIDKPYIENQLDDKNNIRKVYIFPLKLLNDLVPVEYKEYSPLIEKIEKPIKKLNILELEKRSKFVSEKPGTRKIVSTIYERNPYLVELVKRKSKGICDLCKEKAPFKDKKGEHFLEVHHIVWLSQNGEDKLENMVALCPNCHRKMHILNLEEDKKILLNSIIK